MGQSTHPSVKQRKELPPMMYLEALVLFVLERIQAQTKTQWNLLTTNYSRGPLLVGASVFFKVLVRIAPRAWSIASKTTAVSVVGVSALLVAYFGVKAVAPQYLVNIDIATMFTSAESAVVSETQPSPLQSEVDAVVNSFNIWTHNAERQTRATQEAFNQNPEPTEIDLLVASVSDAPVLEQERVDSSSIQWVFNDDSPVAEPESRAYHSGVRTLLVAPVSPMDADLLVASVRNQIDWDQERIDHSSATPTSAQEQELDRWIHANDSPDNEQPAETESRAYYSAVRTPSFELTDTTWAGNALPLSTVRYLVAQYDWDVEKALAILHCESGRNPLVVNDDPSTYDYSVGLFQINLYGYLREVNPSEEWLKDPTNNVEYAYGMYEHRGWNPWRICSEKADNQLQLAE